MTMTRLLGAAHMSRAFVVMAAIICFLLAPGLSRAQTNIPGPTRVNQTAWAGYILYTPGYAQKPVIPQNRFQAIDGTWIVPSDLPTINCDFPPEQTDGSSIWIALDGWGLTLNTARWTDILQAGTETDVPCFNKQGSSSSAYFWIEWNGSKNITTWPVDVGDQIHVRIAATTTGPNAWQEATVYLDNLTTQQSRSITFHSGCLICGNPPVPATLFGNTAEWVVETTFYSATNKCWPNTLNDFGIVQITNMSVTDNQGLTYTPANANGANQEIDWMKLRGDTPQDHGTLLACAALSGPQQIILWRAPYKIVTPGEQDDLEPKPETCNGIPVPPSTP